MMRNCLNLIATAVIAMFFVITAAHASNLPEALLNEPIHLISGEQTSLADFRGRKPVYLKFWATWCQPCRQQMPHFEHVQQEYGSEIEVIAINVGINDDIDTVREAMREFGLTMPMAIDESGDLAQAFRLVGTPYHLVFDRDMNLVHRGHEADSELDSSLALVAQRKIAEIIDPDVLKESEPDIRLDTKDGKIHALLFSATWCDWYWKDSRPEASKMCVSAQERVNGLAARYPDIAWLGVINRLWTGDADLQEYIGKFSVKHPVQIDRSNRLFHQYRINQLPVLLLIKDGEIIARVNDFDDAGAIDALFAKLKT